MKIETKSYFHDFKKINFDSNSLNIVFIYLSFIDERDCLLLKNDNFLKFIKYLSISIEWRELIQIVLF